MTYSVDFHFDLGPTKTDLTLLATLKTMAGGAVDSGLGPITEDPASSGVYWWSYTSFADDTSYRLFLYDGATLELSAAVSPSDAGRLDTSQPVGSSQTAGTVGDALLAAEAQGAGKWTLVANTLTLYRHDGTTVYRTFTIDNPQAPTSRV